LFIVGIFTVILSFQFEWF